MQIKALFSLLLALALSCAAATINKGSSLNLTTAPQLDGSCSFSVNIQEGRLAFKIVFLDSNGKRLMFWHFNPQRFHCFQQGGSCGHDLLQPLQKETPVEFKLQLSQGKYAMIFQDGRPLATMALEDNAAPIQRVAVLAEDCKMDCNITQPWTPHQAGEITPHLILSSRNPVVSQSCGIIPAGDYQLSFKFRANINNQQDGHYGFQLFSGKKGEDRIQFVIREKFYVMLQGKKSKTLKKFSEDFNGKWHEFRLKVLDGNLYECYIDGNRAGDFEATLTPGGKFSFWSYRCWDFEISDILCQPLDDGDDKSAAQDNSANAPAQPIWTLDKVSTMGQEFPNDKGIIGEKGALTMWVRPNWNGLDSHLPKKNYSLLTLKTKANKEVMFLWFWTWLRADIPIADKPWKVEIKADNRNNQVSGDWVHIALVWNDRNNSSVYVNGRLAGTKRFSGSNVKDIKSFFVGSNIYKKMAFDGDIQNLAIWGKAPTPKQLLDFYREKRPLEYMIDNAIYAPGKHRVSFIAAPPGSYPGATIHPEKLPSATANLKVQLTDFAGKTLLTHDFGQITVTEPKNFALPEVALAPGRYYLELAATVPGKATLPQRFLISVADEPKPQNSPAGSALAVGEPIFQYTFPGKYAEAAAVKDANISVEVDIPEGYRNGQMLELEIQWPDDKNRSMAFYMHTPKGSESAIRDRLGGGVFTGEEFPISGKMCSSKYLFRPGFAKYLFEARTLAAGRPAAVSKLILRPVTAPLPELKINLPQGLPQRQFGHLDEDQSFDYNFSWDTTRPKMAWDQVDPRLARETVEYFKYTGQNYLSLPFLRYNFLSYNNRDKAGFNGVFPFHKGGLPYWMNYLADYGIDFFAIVNLHTLPAHTSRLERQELEASGLLAQNNNGGYLTCSPFHPKGSPLVELEEFLKRFANCRGLKGIDIWLEWTGFGFRSIQDGYDDFTVGLFQKETGTTLPKFPQEARFAKRYEYLTSPAMLEKWLKWRSEKTTQSLRQAREMITRYNPKLEMMVTVTGTLMRGDKQALSSEEEDAKRMLLVENCLDIDAVNAIPGVVVSPMRDTLRDRWNQHWDGALSTGDESMWNPKHTLPFLRPSGNSAAIYRRYFESFKKTPMNDKYPGYFQNADPKAAGRYFLKGYALSMALSDPVRLTAGGQPLASMGKEDLIREFVQAYRALPALPFVTVPGATDPVTVRYCHTSNGTYIYAVNMCDATLEVEIAGVKKMRSLSDDANYGKRIQLKPYELRSFLHPKKVTPSAVKVKVPTDYHRGYQERIDALEKALDSIAAITDVKPHQQRLALCKELVKARRYAEATRLLNSRLFKTLSALEEAQKKGWLQIEKTMRDKNHIAVNCGTSQYFCTDSGRLFFPDRQFDKMDCYGYIASRPMQVMRNTDKVAQDDDLLELFSTELYNIEGYRFKVAPGKYKLICYTRIGYDRSRKPGGVVNSYSVNGKEFHRQIDLMQAEAKNGYCTFVCNDIHTTDGIIELRINSSSHPTARMLNAIEVIPVDK